MDVIYCHQEEQLQSYKAPNEFLEKLKTSRQSKIYLMHPLFFHSFHFSFV